MSADYAFIAGTMDGYGGAFWIGPHCDRADAENSERFSDGWILAPARVPPWEARSFRAPRTPAQKA